MKVDINELGRYVIDELFTIEAEVIKVFFADEMLMITYVEAEYLENKDDEDYQDTVGLNAEGMFNWMNGYLHDKAGL